MSIVDHYNGSAALRCLSHIQDCAWILAETSRRRLFSIDEILLGSAVSDLLRHAAAMEPFDDRFADITTNAGNLASALPKYQGLTEQARALLGVLDQPAGSSGSVIAIPHGGPYLATAVEMICAASSDRPVTFTYDGIVAQRLARAGRTAFHDLFQTSPNRPAVEALDLRTDGINAAVRRLRSGGIVVIFADIVNDIRNGVTVPWLEGVRTVMPGAAWLSLMGHASLMAAAPIATADDRIDLPWRQLSPGGPRPSGKQATYNLTLDLWQSFEELFALGATQLRGAYEVFRPAPMRALLDSIETPDELSEALMHFIGPFPKLMSASPSLIKLLDHLHSIPRSGHSN